jgi:type II secretory pathway component GspD/PulD (secretin)
MLGSIRENTYASTPQARFARCGRRSAAGATLILALFATAPESAASAEWTEKPYHYVVIDQDVRGILTEFGRNLGIPVVLSDKVRGRARGELRAKTAGEFLQRIAEAQDLTWYFDGSVLHVSADEEYATQVMDVGVDSSALVRELDRLKLSDQRFSIRATPNSQLVGVSGPPAFIAAVRQTAERLKPPPRVAGDDPRVRVFRGGVKEEVVRTESAKAAQPN